MITYANKESVYAPSIRIDNAHLQINNDNAFEEINHHHFEIISNVRCSLINGHL